MKVLDLTEFYSERGGGVRSHLALKARHLAARGIEHRVVAPGPRDESVTVCQPAAGNGTKAASASARTLRVRGPSLPYDPTYHLLWRLGAVRSLIFRERPDVLEINSPYAAALAGLSVRMPSFRTRTFFWHADFIDTYLRTIATRWANGFGGDLVSRPAWSFVRRIAGACAATVVTSRGQELKLRGQGVPRVVCIPLGVDTGAFAPEQRSEGVRRRLLGAGRERSRLVVGVGRFAFEKRWDVVIDAFSAARTKHDLVLVLFGDGPERARIERRAAECGFGADVRFAGFVRDPATLACALASADLLVHGCPHETFGMSVAEAVSAGLPIVVPDAGGAAEIAAQYASGASAEVYTAESSAACAAAIDRLLARPRSVVEVAAREASRRAPAMSSHFDRLLELYDDLLAGDTRTFAA